MLKIPLGARKSFFLIGPRGTGKTTWIKQQLPQAIYIDLLNTETYSFLLANPHRLVELIPKNYQDWVVIDEVQRIPELLNEVHRLIEEEKRLFVLTGSSARKLRKRGVNLLAGRALVYHLYPLIAQELGDLFDLKQALMYGLLPAILSEPDPTAYLKAYVSTYLREEILQEGLTRNLGTFSRFLETASFSQGQVLNISAIARDAGIEQRTVSNYFIILEDLLLAQRIPIFNKRAKRTTIQHAKFYFFDAGVYQALRPKGFIDSQAEIEGAALETLFLQSAQALNEYLGLGYQFYYWRTRSGIEVDFIFYGEKGFFAFEIKRAVRVSGSDTKGLCAFIEEYPEATPLLIYGGDLSLQIGEVQVLPMRKALEELPKILS